MRLPADFPDAYRVNQWVSQLSDEDGSPSEALSAFKVRSCVTGSCMEGHVQCINYSWHNSGKHGGNHNAWAVALHARVPALHQRMPRSDSRV